MKTNQFNKTLVSSVVVGTLGVMIPFSNAYAQANNPYKVLPQTPTKAIITSYNNGQIVHPADLNRFDRDIGDDQTFKANHYFRGVVQLNLYYTPPTPALNGQIIHKYVENTNSPQNGQKIGQCIIGTDPGNSGRVESGTCLTRDTDTSATPAYLFQVINDGTKQPAYRYEVGGNTLRQSIRSDIEAPSNLQVTLPTGGTPTVQISATDAVSGVGGFYYRWNSTDWSTGDSLGGWSGILGVLHADTKQIANGGTLEAAPKLGLNTVTFWARDNYYNMNANGVTKQFLNTAGYDWNIENISLEGEGKGENNPLKPTIRAKVNNVLKGVKYETQIINKATGQVDNRFTCATLDGTQEDASHREVVCSATQNLGLGELLNYEIKTIATSTLDQSKISEKTVDGSLKVIDVRPLDEVTITPNLDQKAFVTGNGQFTLTQDRRGVVEFNNPGITCGQYTPDDVFSKTLTLATRTCNFTGMQPGANPFTYTEKLMYDGQAIETKNYQETIYVDHPVIQPVITQHPTDPNKTTHTIKATVDNRFKTRIVDPSTNRTICDIDGDMSVNPTKGATKEVSCDVTIPLGVTNAKFEVITFNRDLSASKKAETNPLSTDTATLSPEWTDVAGTQGKTFKTIPLTRSINIDSRFVTEILDDQGNKICELTPPVGSERNGPRIDMDCNFTNLKQGQNNFTFKTYNRNKTSFVTVDRSFNIDSLPPVITPDTSVTNVVKAPITDASPFTAKYYLKDTPTQKTDYTQDTPITITRDMKGKTLVFEATDIHGNTSTKEVPNLVFRDTTNPVVTTDTSVPDKVSATVRDDGPTTCQYWYKDNPAQKFPYTPGTQIAITKDTHGKTIVFSCTDDDGNTGEAETPLTFSDMEPPIIDTKKPRPDVVVADITDKGNTTCQYWYKDNEAEKFPYTSGQEIAIKREHHGKTIVFSCVDEHGNGPTTAEVPLEFSDNEPPVITPALDRPDHFKADITDKSQFTSTYHFKDTPGTKVPYTTGTYIPFTRADHDRVVVFEAVDEHGSVATPKEVTLKFSDIEAPVITPDTNTPDKVKADITDKSPTTSTYHWEDTPDQKIPYTPGTEIDIPRDKDGKKIVFTSTDAHGNGPTVKEVPVSFSDTKGPEITPDTLKQNTVKATITDDTTFTAKTWLKDTPDNKTPYTSDTELPITPDQNGKIRVYEAIDEHGNRTEKEVPLVYVDNLPPVIIPDTSIPDNVRANITDDSPFTSTYHFKDNPNDKKPYTSDQLIPVTRNDHDRVIVFTAIDNANNQAEKEVKLSFSDTTPPTITPNTTVPDKVSATVTDLGNGSCQYWYKDNETQKFAYTPGQEIAITKDTHGKTIVFSCSDEHGNTDTKEAPLTFSDMEPPIIDTKFPRPDVVVADITDKSKTVCEYWYKDMPTTKYPYTSGQEIAIKREHHGKTIVFSCIDEHGNGPTTAEAPLTFSDNEPPVIVPDTSVPDTVKANITDKSPFTATYHYKDNPNDKRPYTSDQVIPIKKEDHGKVIVFTATDEHGSTSEKEAPLVYSDLEAPVITPKTDVKDKVSATITDKSPTTTTVHFKDKPDEKRPYTSGTELPITRPDHGKVLVFTSIDSHGNGPTVKEVPLTFSDIDAPTVDITGPKTSNKPTVPVTGRGEPGATIHVYEGDKKLCETKVKTDGTWTCDTPLKDGTHTLIAKSYDDAGNEGVSQPHTVVVDTTPPKLTGDTPTKKGNDLTFTGKSEPGIPVVVWNKDKTKKICETVTDQSGNWTCSGPDNGDDTFKATACDDHNNCSEVTINKKQTITQGGVVDTAFTGGNVSHKPEVDVTSVPGELTVKITDKDDDLDITSYTYDGGESKDLANPAKIKVTKDMLGKTFVFKGIDKKKNEGTRSYTITEKDLPVEEKGPKVQIIFNPGNQCKGLKQVFTEDQLKFQDIAGSEFSKYIKVVGMYRGDVNVKTYSDFGVVNNVENYNPNRQITRAEYVKMIVRALACNFKAPDENPTFKDVDQNMWYAEYINFAVKEGWVNGYADGTFRPNAPISRGEAAKILANAANLKITEGKVYKDVDTNSEFHKYISTLGTYNIVNSNSEYFNPTANMSRGEFAKVVSNVLMNKK